jgi:hypothetical protein
MANNCFFDSTLSAFDSTTAWTFDATVCPGSAPTPPQGGGKKKRRRYLLPDETLVWATPDEIEEILEQFVVRDEPRPQPRAKRGRKAIPRAEPIVVEDIRWEPVPDVEIETLRPVLPPLMRWSPMRAKLETYLRALRRRQMEEEEWMLL